MTTRSRKRSSWLRKLLFVIGGLLVLLVVAYFVVTSSAFFKGVILPRASKSVSGQITVAEASISPFSRVHLRQLKVQTTGTEPLLQAEEVRLRYRLFSILGGTIKVDELTVVSPVVQIIVNAHGTSNLDPLLKTEEQPKAKPSPPSTKPPQVDLKNVALKSATVRYIKNQKNGGREIVELRYVPPFTFDMVAQVLGTTKSEIYGVLTFYNRFHLTPRGKHTIRACRGTACHFKGAPSIIETIKAHLKLPPGKETTEDFHFSLEEVACLGSCGISPVMAVDEETFGNLTPARAAEVLSQYQAQAAQPSAAGPSGDGGEKQKAN